MVAGAGQAGRVDGHGRHRVAGALCHSSDRTLCARKASAQARRPARHGSAHAIWLLCRGPGARDGGRQRQCRSAAGNPSRGGGRRRRARLGTRSPDPRQDRAGQRPRRVSQPNAVRRIAADLVPVAIAESFCRQYFDHLRRGGIEPHFHGRGSGRRRRGAHRLSPHRGRPGRYFPGRRRLQRGAARPAARLPRGQSAADRPMAAAVAAARCRDRARQRRRLSRSGSARAGGKARRQAARAAGGARQPALYARARPRGGGGRTPR